jgi:hypothetical protein
MSNGDAFRDHPAATPAASSVERLMDLSRILERETELATALKAALEQQRSGVAEGDQVSIHAGTDRIGELITGLQEARVHRRRLLAALGADDSLPLTRLESLLNAPLPTSVDRARARLAEAADGAGRELAINRTVLLRALENGEAFFHALFSLLGRETPSYDQPRARTARTSRTAVLVNKVG